MEPQRRLAAAVVQRRLALGLTQPAVGHAGGPSVATIRSIEKAKRPHYSRLTCAQLERALRWEQGSVQAILDGGDPTELPGTEVDPVEARLWALVDILGEERVREDIAYYRARRRGPYRTRQTGLNPPIGAFDTPGLS